MDRDTKRLIQIVVAAIVIGLLAITAIGWLALNPTGWWSTLTARRLETEPYDLLFGTLIGANTVMIALFFTVAGALLASAPDQGSAYYSRAGIFFPCLLESFCTAALAARAWGFPPYTGALLGLAVLGAAAWGGYIALARDIVKLAVSSTRGG